MSCKTFSQHTQHKAATVVKARQSKLLAKDRSLQQLRELIDRRCEGIVKEENKKAELVIKSANGADEYQRHLLAMRIITDLQASIPNSIQRFSDGDIFWKPTEANLKDQGGSGYEIENGIWVVFGHDGMGSVTLLSGWELIIGYIRQFTGAKKSALGECGRESFFENQRTVIANCIGPEYKMYVTESDGRQSVIFKIEKDGGDEPISKKILRPRKKTFDQIVQVWQAFEDRRKGGK